MQSLEAGDNDAVNKLYMRLERYMKILCGPEFLNFEESENVFAQLDVNLEYEDEAELMRINTNLSNVFEYADLVKAEG